MLKSIHPAAADASLSLSLHTIAPLSVPLIAHCTLLHPPIRAPGWSSVVLALVADLHPHGRARAASSPPRSTQLHLLPACCFAGFVFCSPLHDQTNFNFNSTKHPDRRCLHRTSRRRRGLLQLLAIASDAQPKPSDLQRVRISKDLYGASAKSVEGTTQRKGRFCHGRAWA